MILSILKFFGPIFMEFYLNDNVADYDFIYLDE